MVTHARTHARTHMRSRGRERKGNEGGSNVGTRREVGTRGPAINGLSPVGVADQSSMQSKQASKQAGGSVQLSQTLKTGNEEKPSMW